MKKGTVYKVDGCRVINKKYYYRIYQEDKKGKLVYKGYVYSKDTKDVITKKLKTKKIYVKKGSPLYKNIFLTSSTKEKKDKTEYTTKVYYVINGKKYYSIYKGKKHVGYVYEKSLTITTDSRILKNPAMLCNKILEAEVTKRAQYA